MEIKKITPAVCRKLRQAIDENLAEYAAETGLTVAAKGASYTENSVTFKVEFVLGGVDLNEEEFKETHFLFNLPADAFGKEFTYGGKKYKLVGLKPNRPKYPILAEHGGSRYKLPERSVASLQEKS